MVTRPLLLRLSLSHWRYTLRLGGVPPIVCLLAVLCAHDPIPAVGRSRARARHRITYYVGTGRRIILLTVFAKGQRRERAELERARRTMLRCIEQGHTAQD